MRTRLVCTVLFVSLFSWERKLNAEPCNEMPYHDYPTNYPDIENDDRERMRIWHNGIWEAKKAVIIGFRVKNDTSLIHFKVHDLKTGVVEFECDFGPAVEGECCVDNRDRVTLHVTDACEKRVVATEFTEDHRDVYYIGRLPGPSWNTSIINIKVQTPNGTRRYFYAKPETVSDLVCSEILSGSHYGNIPGVEYLLSRTEDHTVTYDLLETTGVYVEEDEEYRVTVRTFERSEDTVTAYVVYYDEEKDYFGLSYVWRHASGSVRANFRMATERVQLFKDYRGHFYQHKFTWSFSSRDRAFLVFLTGRKQEKLDYITDLLKQWIKYKDKSVKFTWQYGYSPSIRLIPLWTLPLRVVRPGEEVRHFVNIPKVNGTEVKCEKYISESGSYVPAPRWVLHPNMTYVHIEKARLDDTGSYRCAETNSKDFVLPRCEVQVLLEDYHINMSFAYNETADTTLLNLEAQPYRSAGVVFTGSLPFVYCTYQQKPSEHMVFGLVDLTTKKNCTNCAFLRGYEKREYGQSKYEIVYRIGPYKFTPPVIEISMGCASTLASHPNYRYYSSTYTRSDYISTPDRREAMASHRIFYSTDGKPYIMVDTIQTSMTQITNALKQPTATSLNLITVLLFPVSEEPIVGALTGSFLTFHTIPLGWGSVWTIYLKSEGEYAYRDCEVEAIKVTDTHPVSWVFETTYNVVWNYTFTCLLSQVTELIVLNSFNVYRPEANMKDFEKKFRDEVKALLTKFDPSNEESFDRSKLSESNEFHESHRIVRIKSDSTVLHNDTHSPIIYDKLIRSNQPVIFENFMKFGREFSNAASFHKSGSTKILDELIANITVVQHLGKPKGWPLMWIFYENEGMQKKDCILVNHTDLKPLQVPKEAQDNYYYLEAGVGFAEVTFSCTLQAEAVALVMLTFFSKPGMKDMTMNAMETSIKSHLTNWMKNPTDTSPSLVISHTLAAMFTYRIQRLNLAWRGSVLEGEQWRMLVSVPMLRQKQEPDCPELVFKIFYKKNLDDKAEVRSRTDKQLVYLESEGRASLGQTGWYSCSYVKCGEPNVDVELMVRRRLNVFPHPASYAIYFSPERVPITDVMAKSRTEKDIAHFSLFRGESGYIYCVHNRTPEPDMVSVAAVVVSYSMSITRTFLCQTNTTNKDASGTKLFVYVCVFTTKSLMGREFGHLEATCVFKIRPDVLDKKDIRLLEANKQTPYTRSLMINFEVRVAPWIFAELTLSKNVELAAAFQMSRSNPINLKQFEEYTALSLPVNETVQWSVPICRGSPSGTAEAYLYLNDQETGKLVTEPCKLVSSAEMTTQTLPGLILQQYTIPELKKTHIQNFSFACTVKAEHRALGLIAYKDPQLKPTIDRNIETKVTHWLTESADDQAALDPLLVHYKLVRLVYEAELEEEDEEKWENEPLDPFPESTVPDKIKHTIKCFYQATMEDKPEELDTSSPSSSWRIA
ncbi:hypothetical protein CRM22_010705 [Opisthorchis felineus]|uniref:Ig-like domain-containing protein n=1 Tax=Opisthorchis felineus TaxID=147828 RepID=A0A4S2KRL0_OPIFE|nr:hypothetical protein CRM22_010705 [Opisthorchis felineus]